jgi:hypothetical protein
LNQRRPAGGARPARKCQTSQNQPVRVTSAQKRTGHQRRRPRGKLARAEPKIGCTPGTSGGAQRNSRTAESGRPPYEEVAFSGIKGAGEFRILQSRHSEHPYGGNCTARHRARTHSGTSNARRALRLCADLRRIHTGKERCIRDTDVGDGRCVCGRD